MKDSIVRQAANALNKGDYVLALQFYEAAAALLGRKSFEANIFICQKKINSLPKKNEPKSTKNAEPEIEIKLTNSTTWRRTDVSPGNLLSILASVSITDGGKRSGVALIRFLDDQGKTIDSNQIPLPRSEVFGTNFVYLTENKSNLQPILQLSVPPSAAAFEIGFRLFDASKETSITVSNFKFKKIEIKNQKNNSGANEKSPKDFKVAIIADEFTTNSFSSEFIPIPIEPENWQAAFEEHQPDIFFCESAWSGPDSKRRPWKGQIYASINLPYENRSTLLKILAYCRKNSIPTVFWNKEDPTHYTDRVNDFVKTAKEFDFIFTSAAECIDGYKHEHSVTNAFALPFATNPRLFNPIETGRRSSNIVFAGSWYGNHKDRSEAMEKILDQLQAQGFSMEIYDRYYGSSDPIRKWPERYVPFINPSKPHDSMPEVYKSSRFGLNFNTVTDSSTMFARRVFELMSSNTLVVSNYSRGMEEMFGDLVVFADRDPERLRALSSFEIDTLREQALIRVLREHTYKKRWSQMLSAIGMQYMAEDESITIASIIRGREDALLAISWFQQYGRQFTGSRLLLIISAEVVDLEAAKLYQEFNRFGIGVTSLSHATKYALDGYYRPVETPYFALIDPKNLPQSDWLQKAHLHLQYMTDRVIAPAENTHFRYRIAAARKEQPLVGASSLFTRYLKPAAVAGDVYYV